MDLNRGLIILRGRIDIRFAGRNRRVPLDHLGHHPSERLDSEGKGSDIEQQDILDVTGDDPRLYGRSQSYRFVGIHAGVRFLSEKLFNLLYDERHPGGSSDQDDLLDLGGLEIRIFQDLLAWFE